MAMLTRGMSDDTAVKVLSRAVGFDHPFRPLLPCRRRSKATRARIFTYACSAEGLNGGADADKDGYVRDPGTRQLRPKTGYRCLPNRSSATSSSRPLPSKASLSLSSE